MSIQPDVVTKYNIGADAAFEIRRHMATVAPENTAEVVIDLLHPGDVALVHAFGAWRQGVVVKRTPTRVTIAYITPSNRDVIRAATTAGPRVNLYHFARRP